MSGPLNPTMDLADKLLNFVIKDVVQELAIASLLAEVPALNLPVIKQFTIYIINKYTDKFAGKSQLFMDWKIIEGQVRAEYKDYDEKISTLQKLIQEGDNEKIQKELEEARKAMRDLINFDHHG